MELPQHPPLLTLTDKTSLWLSSITMSLDRTPALMKPSVDSFRLPCLSLTQTDRNGSEGLLCLILVSQLRKIKSGQELGVGAHTGNVCIW